MRILIVGNGGREHALLWKLRRDAPAAEFYITRGNGGTSHLATPVPLGPEEIPSLVGWAASRSIDLAVIGPEAPLAAGIADAFIAHGIRVFGPSKDAAQIEASKSHAKRLMRDAGVPTAEYRTFTALADAEAYIREIGGPVVVKASGLAAGKGAVVCDTTEEAVGAVRDMLTGHAFGDAGREVVVEERMQGEELSVFALTDGTDALLMVPAQDHKRIGEGDTGPNTGGMGAYAPVALGTRELMTRIREMVILPTLAAMREEKRTFRGLLYAGLMLTEDGPKVVEFNARFGDPETQAVLPLMSSSLLEPMLAIARGESIAGHEIAWRDAAAVTTVLASGGYPGEYQTGKDIDIPPGLESEQLHIFHSGTRRDDAGRLLTSGGRVLTVTGIGATMVEAAERSRAAARRIAFEGMTFRGDIAWRELARLDA